MFEKQIKKMNIWDWALAKLGVAAFVLFIMTIWPAALNWALGVNTWYFLAVSLIAAAIVLFRIWR
jgi:hypothetical protein